MVGNKKWPCKARAANETMEDMDKIHPIPWINICNVDWSTSSSFKLEKRLDYLVASLPRGYLY